MSGIVSKVALRVDGSVVRRFSKGEVRRLDQPEPSRYWFSVPVPLATSNVPSKVLKLLLADFPNNFRSVFQREQLSSSLWSLR
jgi:hypothetical protein